MKINFFAPRAILLNLCLISFGGVMSQNIADNIEGVKPLMVGKKIPRVDITSYSGKTLNTGDIINKKTILIVYRGGWCPFCNAHLSDVQSIKDDIVKMGYQIVAVSPQTFTKGRDVIDELELSYDLYSDTTGNFIKAMGLAYKPKGIQKIMANKNRDKTKAKEPLLPAPALYVVDGNRKVLFSYVNIDFKKRLKSDVLMGVLKKL